jgi:hypothetical protein
MADRASNDADVSITLPKVPYGGFPQYGFKASRSDTACRSSAPVKPMPGVPGALPRLRVLFAGFGNHNPSGSESRFAGASARRCARGHRSQPQGCSAKSRSERKSHVSLPFSIKSKPPGGGRESNRRACRVPASESIGRAASRQAAEGCARRLRVPREIVAYASRDSERLDLRYNRASGSVVEACVSLLRSWPRKLLPSPSVPPSFRWKLF